MEKQPVSLQIVRKKKASTRFGLSLVVMTSIGIMIVFACLLDKKDTALYFQALLYLAGILSIPILVLCSLLFPHTRDELKFSEQTIREMNQSLFKDCLCYGNGVLLWKKNKISKLDCSEINEIRFFEKKVGIHTTYYVFFYLAQRKITFSFHSRTLVFDDLHRLKKLVQTIKDDHPHIFVTGK